MAARILVLAITMLSAVVSGPVVSVAQAASADNLLASFGNAFTASDDMARNTKVGKFLTDMTMLSGSGLNALQSGCVDTVTNIGGGCFKGPDGNYYKGTVKGYSMSGASIASRQPIWEKPKDFSKAELANIDVNAKVLNDIRYLFTKTGTAGWGDGTVEGMAKAYGFSAGDMVELTGRLYGDDAAQKVAQNFASQGIGATTAMTSNKLKGFQAFNGVIDTADMTGSLIESKIKREVEDSVRSTLIKGLEAAGVGDAAKLNLLSKSQLDSLASKALGINTDELRTTALGRISDKMGFDVTALSEASFEQIQELGFSDKELTRFREGLLDNTMASKYCPVNGDDDLCREMGALYSDNELLGAMDITPDELADITDDVMDDYDVLADVMDDGELAEGVLENIDRDAIQDFWSANSSGSSFSGSSSFVSGTGNGWVIM